MSAVIEVENVTKEFQLGQLSGLGDSVRNAWRRVRGQPSLERQPFKALDDVSFSVQPGEVLGIIGHNGAGKSTLLKLLSNISQPTRGSVRVSGRISPLIEVGAGFVPDFTGRENVFLNASILGMSKAEIRRRFDEIVEFAEMAEFIDTPVKRYSSGMQVKLAFAVATSVEAEILIVDEVLAVGDLAFQRKCFDRMEDLIKRNSRTVLLVSHNIRQVERLCSRVIVMDHGRTAMDGEAQVACNFFYLQSDKQIVKNIANKAALRAGVVQASSGDLELLGTQILDVNGQSSATLTYRDPCTIKLTFRASRALKRLVFGIGVHTPDLLYVANDDSILHSTGVRDVAVGEFSVEYRLPAFPLFPGAYALRLGVAFADNDQALLYAENLCHFQVGSSLVSASRVVGQGFFSLGGNWQFPPPAPQSAAAWARRSAETSDDPQ